MTYSRRAMTLVEIVIAMAIFMTVLVAVTEGTIATRNTFSLDQANDELYHEGQRVLDVVREDLVASGWEFPAGQLDSGTLTASATLDRNRRYFPYIQIQNPVPADATLSTALGAQFPYTHRVPARIITQQPRTLLQGSQADTSRLFGADETGWTRSWHARSQEIIFLKANTGGWSATPWTGSGASNDSQRRFVGKLADWRTGNLDGAVGGKHDQLGILRAAAWKETTPGVFVPLLDVDGDLLPDEPYGVELSSGQIDPGNLALSPTWETITPPDYGWVVEVPAGLVYKGENAANYREYMYAVVPSRIGMGRMVRAVKVINAAAFTPGVEVGSLLSDAAGEGMVIDKVLSDNVVRVVFDTARTTAENPATTSVTERLALNQVRVRIYLARPSQDQPEVVQTRMIDTLVTMRAKLSQSWSDRDSVALGATTIVLDR